MKLNKKGEIAVVAIILDVLKIVLVLAIAGLIIFFFMNSSSPAICGVSAFLRNVYHSFCMNIGVVEAVCISDFTTFEIPLLGCNPLVTHHDSPKYASDFAEEIGIAVASCWVQYGAGAYNVMWESGENPAICAKISANLIDNINAEVITTSWEGMDYKEGYDCTSCENPCGPWEDYGFVCDQSDVTRCIRFEQNSVYCLRNGTLPECQTGQITDNVIVFDKIDQAKFESAFVEIDQVMGNLSSYLCPSGTFYSETGCCGAKYTPPDGEACSQGVLKKHVCVEDIGTDHVCTDTTDFPYEIQLPDDLNYPFIFGLPKDICFEAYDINKNTLINCVYCQTDKRAYQALECVMKKNVNKSECKVKFSMAEFLEPGLTTLYSLKSPTESGIIMGAIDNTLNLTGRVHVFIEFIDSFTGAGKSHGVRVLPEECAAGYFIDSCDLCEDECGSFIFETLMLYSGGGAIKGGAIAALGTTYFSLPEATSFVVSSVVGYAGNIADKLVQCGACLGSNFERSIGFEPDIVACSDKMLICLYEEDTS